MVLERLTLGTEKITVQESTKSTYEKGAKIMVLEILALGTEKIIVEESTKSSTYTRNKKDHSTGKCKL